MTLSWSALAPMILLVSCTYWERQPLPQPEGAKLPTIVRVASGTETRTMVLTEPFVRGDTLYGRTGQDTVGVAFKQIARLERPHVHGWRTFGTVLGGAAAWITVGLLARDRD